MHLIFVNSLIRTHKNLRFIAVFLFLKRHFATYFFLNSILLPHFSKNEPYFALFAIPVRFIIELIELVFVDPHFAPECAILQASHGFALAIIYYYIIYFFLLIYLYGIKGTVQKVSDEVQKTTFVSCGENLYFNWSLVPKNLFFVPQEIFSIFSKSLINCIVPFLLYERVDILAYRRRLFKGCTLRRLTLSKSYLY